MFFVFHILVFAYLTCSETNCFSQGAISEGKNNGGRDRIPNFKEIINAESKKEQGKLDLKSNAYEKILTDEMLSVNDHRDSDETISPLIEISTKALLITPTVEVKQKWPMFKNLHFNSKKGEATTVENTPEVTADYSKEIKEKGPEIKLEVQPSGRSEFVSNKVVGMRSLPMKLALKDGSEGRLCTCMKTNPSTTCSHWCTGSSNKKRCTHSTPRSSVKNSTCTHTPSLIIPTLSPDYAYPPMSYYVPYNSYFSTFPSGYPYTITFPHPYVMSDLKIPPKPKKHKKTTRADEDLYYDVDDNRYKIVYDDNSEEYLEKVKSKKHKLSKTTKEASIHLSLNYVEDIKPSSVKNNKNAAIYDVSQDQLVKEIITDLKRHEHDALKDCYCGSSKIIFKIDIFFVLFVLLYKLVM